jgi:putative SOS response-associated peptidase YedK
MCGRLDQNDISRLIADFSWVGEVINRSSAEGSYNVAPGTYRPLARVSEDSLLIEDRHWGYRSAWAQASGKVPIAINTRLEKITNSYWRKLLQRGRAIIPADGWYEWTGEKGDKQPWHIHRGDRSPLFIAALGNFEPDTEHKASNGFTVITADAEGGMVDVHDRRPVVLSEADAALWLDLDLPAEQAEQLLRSSALGPVVSDNYLGR